MSEMTFNEIGGATTYINVAPKGVPAFEVGQVVVEGIFKRTFQGKFGLQHEFIVGTEKKVVNGFGALNYKLQDVPANTMVRVVYNGKGKLTKGKMAGRDFHDCKVFVANASVTMTETKTDAQDDSFLA